MPADLSAEAILERLVVLNCERAGEEKRGLVRWLRPDYQASKAKVAQPVQEEMAVGEAVRVAGTATWPKALPDQFQALTRLLDETAQPIELRQATKRFKGAKSEASRGAAADAGGAGSGARVTGAAPWAVVRSTVAQSNPDLVSSSFCPAAQEAVASSFASRCSTSTIRARRPA